MFIHKSMKTAPVGRSQPFVHDTDVSKAADFVCFPGNFSAFHLGMLIRTFPQQFVRVYAAESGNLFSNLNGIRGA